MHPFKRYGEAAVIECDPDTGKPLEGGRVIYGTVTEARPCCVTARINAETWVFLVDSRGRLWMDAGRWRLVSLCRRPACDRPVLDSGVDPVFCSGECRDDEAQAQSEHHHRPR